MVEKKFMLTVRDHQKTYLISFFVAFSCILQISESLIPHPIPGLRLGLANMLTLMALVTLGFRYAIEISVLRTVLTSFIMGSFMSPGFILSFSAALASALVMGFFYQVSHIQKHVRFSIIGISIIGAFTHNMVQLYLAYLILVKHDGIFIFFPWLTFGAIVTGSVTGVVVAGACRKLNESPQQTILETAASDFHPSTSRVYVAGDSFLHKLSPEIKIITIFLLSSIILFFSQAWLYLCLYAFLSGLIILSKTPVRFIFTTVSRYAFLILFTFFLPVFFNPGTHVLLIVGAFELTAEGLFLGAGYSLRIVFLILLSALVMRTSSSEEMTDGLAKVLGPLRFIGISGERIAGILSLSLAAMPSLWDTTRRLIHSANFKKSRNLRNLIPLLSGLMAALYLEAGNIGNALEPVDADITGATYYQKSNKSGYNAVPEE
jgi:uncharacterized membrane protein/energy-coupling factor transporter transmembrane protein EcfT